MNNIKYHLYPKSEEEVLRILQNNTNSQILAGGTDLSINTDKKTETLIDIQNLPLKYINESKEGFSIGALTSAYELYTYEKFSQSLRDAAFKVADMPLLHAVTIGGNLAKLYPWCDLPPMLWALNATIKLFEPNGDFKELSADDFFLYSREQNVSKRKSLIKEIFVPKNVKNSFSQYQKFTLTEIEKGQVNFASFFKWDENGNIIDVKLIVSAITKTIERLDKIEKILLGKKITEDLIDECVNAIRNSVEIVKNYKSSIKFREQILRTYLRRTLLICKSKMEENK